MQPSLNSISKNLDRKTWVDVQQQRVWKVANILGYQGLVNQNIFFRNSQGKSNSLTQ